MLDGSRWIIEKPLLLGASGVLLDAGIREAQAGSEIEWDHSCEVREMAQQDKNTSEFSAALGEQRRCECSFERNQQP
jgi:hypothetical protein